MRSLDVRNAAHLSPTAQTTAKRNYIINTLAPSLVTWVRDFLRTKPVSGDLRVSGGTCLAQLSLPTRNVANADLAVFVTGWPAGRPSILAFAAACRRDGKGRPTAGMINWAPRHLDPSATSATQLDFWRSIMVARHELLHVLAFTPSSYDRFVNPATEAPLGASNVVTSFSRNGKSIVAIRTPKVVAEARAHFGCSSLANLELDELSTAHWEARLMKAEIMEPQASTETTLSRMTAALLEDSGWYTASYSETQQYIFGAKEGCAFATGSCGNWPGDYAKCAQSGVGVCAYDRRIKGVCQLATWSGLPAHFRYYGAGSEQAGTNQYPDCEFGCFVLEIA